ncbi:hypothetical protein PM10SUCC1_28310 [Propionigenium maris DSM 9537]|uniref:EVE domain-containing protein n=1 Tax=Propionigenium maris DSM 9537 TaxID=1123000 RepID=A0A9W6LP82_9FUSO|nr:hypothetical protein [Propionigenium maris]GLI57317.1 hypothetical protein PM10SUCC1_28310 [Propionigenium maris DSM 9537]
MYGIMNRNINVFQGWDPEDFHNPDHEESLGTWKETIKYEEGTDIISSIRQRAYRSHLNEIEEGWKIILFDSARNNVYGHATVAYVRDTIINNEELNDYSTKEFDTFIGEELNSEDRGYIHFADVRCYKNFLPKNKVDIDLQKLFFRGRTFCKINEEDYNRIIELLEEVNE